MFKQLENFISFDLLPLMLTRGLSQYIHDTQDKEPHECHMVKKNKWERKEKELWICILFAWWQLKCSVIGSKSWR